MAALQGMHVSPAKHSYARLPRKCDYRTQRQMQGQTDDGQSDPYVPLCFKGDTVMIPVSHSAKCRQHKIYYIVIKLTASSCIL